MSTLLHAQSLSPYTSKAKRDSELTAIALAKASQEEPELFQQFYPHFDGDVVIEKHSFTNSELNDDDSILYQLHNTKIGDIYYVITLPCTNDWYGKVLFKPYFVKMWILDTKEPVVIHFGASEFTYRCSSEIRDAQKLSSIADLTKCDSILRSIVVAQTKKEIPDVIAKYKYRFDKGHTVKRLVINSDDLTNPLSFLYKQQGAKLGDSYYIVTLKYGDNWYEDGLYASYFVKMWVLDTGRPIYIHPGDYELEYKCRK